MPQQLAVGLDGEHLALSGADEGEVALEGVAPIGRHRLAMRPADGQGGCHGRSGTADEDSATRHTEPAYGVNSVHPGITATPIVLGTSAASRARLDKALAMQPIPRIGRPEEIANAVLFFASDESSYCTGTSLVVDGGHIAGMYRDPL